jgi:hypothetical protein
VCVHIDILQLEQQLQQWLPIGVEKGAARNARA